MVDGRIAMAFVLGCCGHGGRVLLCVSSSGRVAALVWAKNAAGFSSGGSPPVLSSSVENASHFAALPGPLCCCVNSLLGSIHTTPTPTRHKHQGCDPAYLRMCCCIYVYGTFVRHLPFRCPFCFCGLLRHAALQGRPWVEALLPSISPSLRSFGWDLLRHAATHAHCSLLPYIHTYIVESDEQPLTISPTAVCAHMAQQWQLGCNVCSSYKRSVYARILRRYW